jgi:hypothetical protein
MRENIFRDRSRLGVRGNKCFLISVFSRLAMCTAITLAQGSEGVNPLGTEAAEITGSGRGDKGWK